MTDCSTLRGENFLSKNTGLTAIVLAGGLGRRLRPVVSDRPKPMAIVAGRPFLERVLEYWVEQGVGRFILSVGYLAEQIQDHFGASFFGVPIEYCVEEEPLGTGGALLACHKKYKLNHPFLIINGDTYFEVDTSKLAAFIKAKTPDLVLSVFQFMKSSDRYLNVNIEAGDRLGLPNNANECTKWANGGVCWINGTVLRGLTDIKTPLSLESELIPRLMLNGTNVFCYRANGIFIDIGVPLDYERAQTLPPFKD